MSRFKAIEPLTFILSCNKSEDTTKPDLNTEDPKDEEPEAEDETKPVITVNGFTDIIETTTEISISIVHDSTIETKISYDGEELGVSSEKQFDLSINPYVIPVGTKDFMVVATDAKGNETSEMFSVEIKHLLIDNYWLKNGSSEVQVKNWLFFNSLDGKELAVFEPTAKNQKVYTDEIILEDKVLFSTADYVIWTPSSENSAKSLNLRTYKISLGGKRSDGVPNNNPEFENTSEVKLNGIPFVNYSPDYYAFGAGYSTTGYSGDDLQTTLTIKHDAIQPIFIRTNRWGGSTPKFDGKKENYRYVILTPESGSTNIIIEADQLIAAENSLKLGIPEQDPGTLFFHRNAYENVEDLTAFRRASIYDKDSSNETGIVDYLDLPKFSMFNYYDNELSYAKNGAYYSARGTDTNLDVHMPNWSASVQINDNNIEVNANNQEVDYYSVRLQKQENGSNGSSRFINWSFNVFGEGNVDKRIPFLEIPELIKETMTEPYFKITNDLEVVGLTAVDYANIDSYDEIVEWFVFNRSDLVGSGNQYRQVGFPTSSSSGKSVLANRPWYLDALHRYNLDEMGQVRKK